MYIVQWEEGKIYFSVMGWHWVAFLLTITAYVAGPWQDSSAISIKYICQLKVTYFLHHAHSSEQSKCCRIFFCPAYYNIFGIKIVIAFKLQKSFALWFEYKKSHCFPKIPIFDNMNESISVLTLLLTYQCRRPRQWGRNQSRDPQSPSVPGTPWSVHQTRPSSHPDIEQGHC